MSSVSPSPSLLETLPTALSSPLKSSLLQQQTSPVPFCQSGAPYRSLDLSLGFCRQPEKLGASQARAFFEAGPVGRR